jgi:hypothetical protein
VYYHQNQHMKTFLVLIVLSLQFLALSQLEHESKIESVYGYDWLQRMKSENPELLALMDKYVEFGFTIQQTSEGKYSEVNAINSIPLTSKNNEEISISQFVEELNSTDFNPLRYRFFPTKEYQIFKLNGENKIIYILPQELILSK